MIRMTRIGIRKEPTKKEEIQMKKLLIKLALAASVANGAGAVMAQDMVEEAKSPQTVTEQMDPDKGPQIVRESEEKQAEVKEAEEKQAESEKFIPANEAVRLMLKKQLNLREGYDRSKKSIIVIGEAAIKMKDPSSDKMFMNTRALKAMEAYLNAKAEIVRSINNDVKGVDRVACQNEFGEDKVEKVVEERKAAFEAKKAELAKKLAVLDEKEADALAGVTVSDRFNALLDGIIKKIDGEYSKDQIAGEKKAAYESMKAECAALMDEYKQLEKAAKALPKYPKNEVGYDAVMISKMPILGAAVLLQSESWDKDEKVYEVAMAVVWSPKLQAKALNLIMGNTAPTDPKGKFSVDDWIDSQYLPAMIGPRRITDKDGYCVFLGIGAEDISGSVIDRKAKKALADTDAILAVSRSLYSDIESYREAKRNLKEYMDDVNTSKAKLAEVVSSKTDTNLKGCSRLTAMECEHPITGRRTYVSVYYIDPELNKAAAEIMKKAYADAGLAEKATQYARGVHAGHQKALDNVRKSKEEFNRGVRDGSKAVDDEMKRTQSSKAKAGSLGGEGSRKPASTKKSKGGTFSGDSNVDTNF